MNVTGCCRQTAFEWLASLDVSGGGAPDPQPRPANRRTHGLAQLPHGAKTTKAVPRTALGMKSRCPRRLPRMRRRKSGPFEAACGNDPPRTLQLPEAAGTRRQRSPVRPVESLRPSPRA